MLEQVTQNITIYHGSSEVIGKPCLEKAKPNNDFGRGFYCTQDLDLAREWACSDPRSDGYANEYHLQCTELKVLDLGQEGTVAWAATVMYCRRVTFSRRASRDFADAFISENRKALENYDLIIGPRADDSYYDIIRAYASGELSLADLDASLRLGSLGDQIVLKTQAAFDALEFVTAHKAAAVIWYPRRTERNKSANRIFFEREARCAAAHGKETHGTL